MGLLSDVDEYLQVLKSSQSSFQTQKNYRHYLDKFLDFMSGFRGSDNRRLTRSLEINSGVIRSYRLYLSRFIDPKTGQPYRRSTQNYHLIALRQFFRYLSKKQPGGLDYRSIGLHDQPTSAIRVIAEADFARLLKAVDVSHEEGLRDRAILTLLFSTGLRVSQLSGLNREDIQVTVENACFFLPTLFRPIRLDSQARKDILSYLSSRHDLYAPLFIRYRGQVSPDDRGERMRLSTRSIERMVKKYEKSTRLRAGVTPQTLRHSFAVRLLKQGADVEAVRQSMDYSSAMSVKRYVTLRDET